MRSIVFHFTVLQILENRCKPLYAIFEPLNEHSNKFAFATMKTVVYACASGMFLFLYCLMIPLLHMY